MSAPFEWATVHAVAYDLAELRRKSQDAFDVGVLPPAEMQVINQAAIDLSNVLTRFISTARATPTVVERTDGDALREALTASAAVATYMATTCRINLGHDDHFEALGTALDEITTRMAGNPVVGNLLRYWAYRSLSECSAKRTMWKVLDPEWCRRRDRAFARIARDIEELRSVALDAPWPVNAKSNGAERIDSWLIEISRQLEALQCPTVERGGRLVVNPLAASRQSLGATISSAVGGRPKETWRSDALVDLRNVGFTLEDAEALLDAAGLIAPYPTRKS